MEKLISVIILICFFNLTFGQNQTYTLLIDTYVSSSGNDGIYVYDFNSQTGDFKFKSKVEGEDKPSYVTTSCEGNDRS